MRINNNGSIDNKESNHKYIFDLNGNWVSKKTEEYEPTEKAQSLKRSEIRRKFYYFN